MNDDFSFSSEEVNKFTKEYGLICGDKDDAGLVVDFLSQDGELSSFNLYILKVIDFVVNKVFTTYIISVYFLSFA